MTATIEPSLPTAHDRPGRPTAVRALRLVTAGVIVGLIAELLALPYALRAFPAWEQGAAGARVGVAGLQLAILFVCCAVTALLASRATRRRPQVFLQGFVVGLLVTGYLSYLSSVELSSLQAGSSESSSSSTHEHGAGEAAEHDHEEGDAAAVDGDTHDHEGAEASGGAHEHPDGASGPPGQMVYSQTTSTSSFLVTMMGRGLLVSVAGAAAGTLLRKRSGGDARAGT